MNKLLKRTWAEIDLDHLAHNVAVLRGGLPETTRFLGVVKADGYGHGAVPVAKELQRLGADYLAVSNLEEAAQLRRGGISLPILILGYTPPEYAQEEAELGITQEVHCLEYGRALSQNLREGQTLNIHFKLDTGMSRLGFFAYDRPETVSEIAELAAMPKLHPEGAFMHFAVADDPSQEAYTFLQHDRFLGVLDALEKRGVVPEIVHCANSGATLSYPAFAHGMALLFPTVDNPEGIPPFDVPSSMGDVFFDYARWLDVLGLSYMNKLHHRVTEGRSQELILINPRHRPQKLQQTANPAQKRITPDCRQLNKSLRMNILESHHP